MGYKHQIYSTKNIGELSNFWSDIITFAFVYYLILRTLKKEHFYFHWLLSSYIFNTTEKIHYMKCKFFILLFKIKSSQTVVLLLVNIRHFYLYILLYNLITYQLEFLFSLSPPSQQTIQTRWHNLQIWCWFCTVF